MTEQSKSSLKGLAIVLAGSVLYVLTGMALYGLPPLSIECAIWPLRFLADVISLALIAIKWTVAASASAFIAYSAYLGTLATYGGKQ